MKKEVRELNHLENWEHMMHFAIELINQSKLHKGTGIWGERIIILHLDHANELLMKAFLIKKGYVISYIEKNEVGRGIKKKELLNRDKTIDYNECLKIICGKELTSFPTESKEKILKFHKLRNEIQHRAINIPQNKGERIKDFYTCFEELYSLMFPEFADAFPKLYEN